MTTYSVPGTQITLFLLQRALFWRVEAQKWRTISFQVYIYNSHLKTTLHQKLHFQKLHLLFIIHPNQKFQASAAKANQNHQQKSSPTFDCTSRCIGVRNVTLQKRSHAAAAAGHLGTYAILTRSSGFLSESFRKRNICNQGCIP